MIDFNDFDIEEQDNNLIYDKIFAEWLVNNNIYDKYLNNIMLSVDVLKDISRHKYITHMFIWDASHDGNDFWKKMNNKWIDYIKSEEWKELKRLNRYHISKFSNFLK